MAISKIILGGYKSFRERTEIPIAPLTLLFGPNSSGKSTVLHAAGLLREEIKQTPADRRNLAYLYGMLVDGPARYVHRLPHNGILADPVLVPLTLGVEIDPVSTEIGTTNPDEQWNVAREIATQLYWGLAGTRVRLEFTTKSFAFVTEVAVDGQTLLEIVDSNTWAQYLKVSASAAEPKSAKPARKKEPRRDTDSLGAVSLNIDHPLWTVDPRMAMELRTLKRLAKGAKSHTKSRSIN